MKKIGKIIGVLIVILIALAIYWSLLDTETIRNYRIKGLYIDAVIEENGDMKVKEDSIYRFNGKYNGITITIPDSVSKEYYENVTKDSINDLKELPDSLYISSGIEDVNIYVIENGEKKIFNQVGTADIGDMGVYTVSKEDGYTTYKIFEPSKNENKEIVIEYTLKNAAVLHNDIGEIYWNFVGGNVECRISKLSINVSSSSGATIFNQYTHGNSSGKIEEITNSEVNATYKNVKSGEYVSMRVLFDKSALKSATKTSDVVASDLIAEQEKSYSEKSMLRSSLNVLAVLGIVGIITYWIYLLIKYEKDIFIPMTNVDDMEMLEKYNPMIAACIAQNRGMHPRDIIAVLIDLVNIGALDMKVEKNIDKYGKVGENRYILNKNKKFFEDNNKVEKLDSIQNSIIEMFFPNESCIGVELMEKLKSAKYNSKFENSIKNVDEQCTKNLEKIGANLNTVPKGLLFLNNCMFFITLVYIVVVIAYNLTLNISTLSTSKSEIIGSMFGKGIIVVIISLVLYPIAILLIKIILSIIVSIKRSIAKISFKLTSKKLTRAIISMAIIFLMIFSIEVVLIRESYLLICTILLFSALLLIITDNLMTSHSNKVKKDYFRLKMIQEKIEDGSLLEEKSFEHSILWKKYLTFAIALGVGNVAEYVRLIDNCSELSTIFDEINTITDGYFNVYFIESDRKSDERIGKLSGKIDRIIQSSSDGGRFILGWIFRW